jgi:hypothetical protein
MEMKKEQFAKEYRRWLREYPWSFYANLKVQPATDWMRRDYMLDTWIAGLRHEEGARDFHWISVAETRFMKTRPELHVWVGGLRDRLEYWASRWKQLGGKATIEIFDPKQNEAFCRTTVETMDDNDTLEIESEFPQKEASSNESGREIRGESRGSVKLRVENVDEDTTLENLRSQFEKYGTVEEISIHSGTTFGEETLVYALITMPMEDARKAMSASYDSWDRERLEVMWARRHYGPWLSPGWKPPK